MTLAWTSEQVLALSPDASSTKNGKALAQVAKWPLLGRSDQAVWGECKGSGKNPYRTQIDLSEPAFRCSCPSRKFPCKHALGLFLLLAEQTDVFSPATPPDWVAEWLAKRSQTATRKQEQKTKAATDLVAQAKRAEKRAAKVEAGLADLNQWLQDMMRQGLAALPNQPYSFWDQAAARLVDAQAPGLARRVRALASIPHTGNGWPERMLQALGRLHLLVQGYSRLASLSPQLQAEVRSQIGWPQTQADLRQRVEQADPLVECLTDTWQVLGKSVTEEEELQVQRVWLWGTKHNKAALVLSFAHGRQLLDVSLVPGTCFRGELIFYPGTGVQRAFVASPAEAVSQLSQTAPGFEQIEWAIAHYAAALSQNPWLERFPLTLRQVLLRYHDDTWWLQDEMGQVLRLSPHFSYGWEFMAMGGGYPLTIFGEWDGTVLLPLSLWIKTQFMTLEN
ncbi:MAG: SWIM zinc finger family protein [Cyanothece sp. SIO1E1]|nr:SWIM zinc finger family protein [Cyanothece sp. SIO1E1]